MDRPTLKTKAQQVKRPVIIILATIGICLSLISFGLGEQTPEEHRSYFKNPVRLLLEPLPLIKHTNKMSES
ncbi:MAG: hypothetical protein HWE27_04600 [Gammaproteobacteria bacterium]|nr:hypothetical protein [Gammaproteobacteria bacterium]